MGEPTEKARLDQARFLRRGLGKGREGVVDRQQIRRSLIADPQGFIERQRP